MRQFLYRIARIIGDLSAATSGSPGRIGRRAANKMIGRKVVSRLWW